MEPGKTRVMEPVLSSQIKNENNTVYQVKWDGVRMLSFVEEKHVVLQNRRGRIKTGTFPELDCLASLSQQPLILDGEVVVIKNGRPDFSMVLRRNFSSQPRPGASPAAYIIFDILRWKGEDVRGRTLSQRQELLASMELPPGSVTVIDNFRDGEKLFRLTKERDWEGVVAKDISSPYVSGKSPFWCKYKNKKTGLFNIVGYITRQDQLASLLVAVDFGEGLVLAGSVGSGLSNASRRMLQEILPKLSTPEPPVPAKRRQDWTWVKPVLQAEVVFMEWTEGLTLRSPVLKGILLEGKKYELP